MTMIRKIRNAALCVSILFVGGILGSLELDSITLSQAVDYIALNAVFCAFVMVLEVLIRFFRALLVVYARRKRRARKAAFRSTSSSKAGVQPA